MKNYVRITGLVLITVFICTGRAECQSMAEQDFEFLSEAQYAEDALAGPSAKNTNDGTFVREVEQLRSAEESNMFQQIFLIELLSFDAKVKDRQIELSWSTLFEFGNDFFAVERSVDGLHWEMVDKLNGAGNSGLLVHYSSRDEYPTWGVSYYRLTQTDFNGAKKQVGVQAVNYVPEEEIEVYPNPTSGKLSITADQYDIEAIEFYDSKSQSVLNEVIINSSDGHIIELDLENLPAGIYYVHIGSALKKVHKL